MLKLLSFFLLCFFCFAQTNDQNNLPEQIVKLHLNATINPGTQMSIQHAIEYAEKSGAKALLIQMNTPGGLVSTTREIVQNFSRSSVPIIVYIGPSGASATSAGAFITIAGHLAIMNKGTNIGAASPVSDQGKDIGETMAKKVMNDTVAFMKGIAVARGRNEIEAVSFVADAKSITAEEAKTKNVIDLVINDESELLETLAGQTIQFKNQNITLSKNLKFIENKEHIIDQLLIYLAHPQLAYLLMLAGIIGLYIEITHPGVIFPGVFGGICLILAMVCLQTLPVSIGFFMLLGLGILLMGAEAFVPSFGALGIGGFISFVLGSIYLFEDPQVSIPLSTLIPSFLLIGAIFLTLAYLVIKSRKRKQNSYTKMIGKEGRATEDFEKEGWVLIAGERWLVHCDQAIQENEKIIVVEQDTNRKLKVKKI